MKDKDGQVKRMQIRDLVIFICTFIINSVVGLGKRVSSSYDDDDTEEDWFEKLFSDSQVVTVAVIIILVTILIAIGLFQTACFCRMLYR